MRIFDFIDLSKNGRTIEKWNIGRHLAKENLHYITSPSPDRPKGGVKIWKAIKIGNQMFPIRVK